MRKSLKLSLILAVAAASLFSSPARADTFEDGMAAYRKGDYGEAMKLLRPLADQDHAGAEKWVGVMYLHGFGVAKNEAEGIAWIMLAAGEGNADAQTLLGNLYFGGTGVRRDMNLSTHWLRRAADQGYPEAQYDLGAHYENGFGVAQDYIEATKWSILAIARYEPSAVENRRVATVNRDRQAAKLSPAHIAEAERRALAWRPVPFQKTNEDRLRDAGIALQRNENPKAARLYRVLADQGVAEAQTMLGAMYQAGMGVVRDQDEAVKLFRLAARQGDAGAQDSLGSAYEKGRGAPKDSIRAYMWYELASSSGDSYAAEWTKHRDKLAGLMTREQITAAVALAAKCKASAFMDCD